MPTIDELDQAVVAADDDILPVSQSGTARRITRSQLLAGTQASLSLFPGLLGRSSPGLGPPQSIHIGTGLSLADGTLASTAQYSAAALPRSPAIGLGDYVPIWQNGVDRSVSVRTLLSAKGVDVSDQSARSPAGVPRRIVEWLGDAVAVEAFGAAGDGTSDDTAAFNQAIASGVPVRLGPKTYRVDGQWDIQSPAVLLGTPGLSRLLRVAQRGGAWINVTASSLLASDIIFDAGSLEGDSWGVLLAASCIKSIVRNCDFVNATGATLGSGLTIQARDGLIDHRTNHSIQDCTFEGNAGHGLWLQAACGAVVRNCTAFRNGKFGICLDFNDPAFGQQVRQSLIANCRCISNERGISVGNYNSTNSEPPRWGLEHPDVTDINIENNICANNSAYGIAVSGARIQVRNNQINIDSTSGNASGILCNASASTIAANIVTGSGQYGIDAGGCADVDITGNTISFCSVGINAGGSVRGMISENKLLRNDRSITVFHVETDGRDLNFGIACKDMQIEGNVIDLGQGQGGIYLIDGPERVRVVGNRFTSQFPTVLNALLWAHTDSVSIERNQWNGSPNWLVGGQLTEAMTQICVPDVLDLLTIPSTTSRVDGVMGFHANTVTDQVTFVRVTDGGAGYSRAEVKITGIGTGATARAYIRDGAIIGVAMLQAGNGYSQAGTTALITGDGQGASASAFVGLPIDRNRLLTLRCLSDVLFAQHWSGSQSNWTGADITVPANTDIICQGNVTGWQAVQFTATDYVSPSGDGSVALQSRVGHVGLRPGADGGVCVSSAAEKIGFLMLFGRGSPEGKVTAPPGSDYRDLNGGVGHTLWLKRTGTDSSGWFAVA